ncbi:MAG: hypothetical protein ACI4ES_15555 [Roseburia sp.]
MKKRIFALALAVMMVTSFATTASAAETQNPYELPYDVNTGEMFESSVSTGVGDLITRAILGTGTLYHSDPLIGKPEAYAYTEAYETSYRVRAKCDVNSNGEGVETTGWKELKNTKACNSGTIKATTARCIFDGFHEIQVTTTSAMGSAQTTASYE